MLPGESKKRQAFEKVSLPEYQSKAMISKTVLFIPDMSNKVQ